MSAATIADEKSATAWFGFLDRDGRTASRSNHAAPWMGSAGFTLLEVMVVLLLISMLMGIGIGAFSKVGGGPTLARSQIREVVRTTRLHALRERAPSVAVFDAETGTTSGVGWKLVGCWHFETAARGNSPGFPVEATVDRSLIAPGGVLGNCLDLTEAATPGIVIPVVSSLNALNGVALELFVRLREEGPRFLMGKGDFYNLTINEEGYLLANLKLLKPNQSRTAAPELYQIIAEEYRIPLNTWVKVALHFNGYSAMLTVDGLVRAEESFPERKRLATNQTTPLLIGNRREPFSGYVDEVRIGSAVAGEEMKLPENISLEGGSLRIHFDRNGHLDRDFHTAPVKLVLRYGERASTALTVGLFGEIW